MVKENNSKKQNHACINSKPSLRNLSKKPFRYIDEFQVFICLNYTFSKINTTTSRKNVQNIKLNNDCRSLEPLQTLTRLLLLFFFIVNSQGHLHLQVAVLHTTPKIVRFKTITVFVSMI